ncbi:hypothetical protein B296_00049047 [Ensete ventricosum]|uniref:Uncharacterized protein n=1 Tax=Ensete ventricosum TaxID=4639 RepID=A0A426XL01_ENSVE|nr:hypothetical protein B296_00049047 [Ensete ventricosum]
MEAKTPSVPSQLGILEQLLQVATKVRTVAGDRKHKESSQRLHCCQPSPSPLLLHSTPDLLSVGDQASSPLLESHPPAACVPGRSSPSRRRWRCDSCRLCTGSAAWLPARSHTHSAPAPSTILINVP